VQYGLKNFDLVFVFHVFSKPPIHIDTIPMSQLENVKEWLDSVDIAFSEGPVNLSWSQIMKTINDDPEEFFANGGWNFLGGDDSNPGSDNDSESESGSNFNPSGDESEESGNGSSFDDDASNKSEDESVSFEDGDSGEDWDEMEARAAKKDAKKKARGRDADSDDDGGGKKGKKGSSGGGSKKHSESPIKRKKK